MGRLVMVMTDEEYEKTEYWSKESWEYLRDKNGWELPEKAVFWKRWPVIRFVRYVYHGLKFIRHIQRCQALGLGLFPQQYDEWVLYAIRRGWC